MRDLELFDKYAASKSIPLRNSIVIANLGLARMIAHRYKNSCSIPYEDLEQVASLGLIKAVEGFNPSLGNAFSSYALPWIRGEVLHFIRDKTTWFSATRKIAEARRETATAEQLQEINQISVCASLDNVVGYARGGSAITLGETIGDEREELLRYRRENRSVVAGYLKTLSPKHRRILVDFFYKGASLSDIAQKLGYSNRNRVAVEKIRALQRIRRTVGDQSDMSL